MAIRGLNLGQTWDYQSDKDPDKGTSEATTFVLRTLDSRVMGYLRDGVAKVFVDHNKPDDMAETQINMQEMNFQTGQFGIDSWTNLIDTDGSPIEFRTVSKRLGGKEYKIVATDVMCRLPIAVISELAEEIRKDNELSDDDAGK